MSFLTVYLLPLLAIMSLWLAIYYFFFYKEKSFCRILLTEMVGDAEVYRGMFHAFKQRTTTAEFLGCKKLSHFAIDLPDSKDYLHADKGSKIILVCKYGERDFRVKKKFDSTYYKDITQVVYDEVEDENGEMIKQPRLDENGNPIYEVLQVPYEEPRGVDQKGMDAIRTGLQNERELNKEAGENTFWNKYGKEVVFIGAIMIIAMLMMKTTGDTKEIFISNGESCSLAAGQIKEIGKKVDNPSWARSVIESVANNNANEPPPK